MSDRLMLWTTGLFNRISELRNREEGQAAVEYGVLLALILAVCIVLIGDVGDKVSTAFQTIKDNLP
jgi:Flp pilus assembly pilin Flp